MRRNGLAPALSIGVVLAFSLVDLTDRACAGERRPAKDSQLAQLYIRLLGTSA